MYLKINFGDSENISTYCTIPRTNCVTTAYV